MPNQDLVESGALSALVGDPPSAGRAHVWQVGHAPPPSAPDPAGARAARLEARLAVYAQYAAVVAEEAAAAVAGNVERSAALRAARDAAAEHFAELRGSGIAGEVAAESAGAVTFSDALTDALHELRHQEAVDDALARRLRALHDAAAARNPARDLTAALPAGASPARLDVRF